VEISPTSEFNEGRTNKIMGKVYNTASLFESIVPENKPIIDDINTIRMDSLNIFLK
jgi:hypothetical protein